jgi:hypothetical protein
MTEAAENTSASGLTTDQIAGVSPRSYDDNHARSDGELTPSSYAAPDQDLPSNNRDEGQRVQLLGTQEMREVLSQWREIQGEFVDEPRKAIQDADSLVADLMQRLAKTFADERNELETQLADGSNVSTEDMRQGLQRYRSFFERLLAA